MVSIAQYTIDVSSRIDQASFKRIDMQLRRQEKLMQKHAMRMRKTLDSSLKGMKMPELKLRGISLDTVAIQKKSQTSLNQISRLLTLNVSNFNIDEGKLTKQLQGVMNRASNVVRMNMRSIQGSAGGSNNYYPRAVKAAPNQTARQYIPQQHQSAFAGARNNLDHATSMMLPGRLAGLSGAGLAIAAPFAAGYAVQRGSVSLGNDQAQREAQRVQLDVASGSADRSTRDKANKQFFQLSNDLGVEAEGLVDPYSKFLKQMTTMGRTYEQGFDLFKDMSVATRGAGGGQQQMERQAFALQQIIGLGHLRAEELNLQLSDALPSIKKYIMQAYADRTGDTGVENFNKAMSKRQVSIEDVLQAYKNAAEKAGHRVEEFASTVQGAQSRLANLKFEEQLSRTLTDDVLPGMREYVEAQRELYEAMGPLRDATYEAAAGMLSFSASIIKTAAPVVRKVGEATNKSPALRSIVKNPMTYLPDINPVLSTMKYAAIAGKAYRDSRPGPGTANAAGVARMQGLQDSFKGKARKFTTLQDEIASLASKNPVAPPPLDTTGYTEKKMTPEMSAWVAALKVPQAATQGVFPLPKRETPWTAPNYKEDQFNQTMHSMQEGATYNNSSTNTFTNTFEISTNATDASTLATELEPFMTRIFKTQASDLFRAAMPQFGNKETN